GIYESTVSRRLLTNTILSYEPSDNSNILIGIESFEDKGDARAEIDFLFQNGKKEVYYYNHAAFVQGLFRTKWFTLTAGGRIDHHSKFGDAFAPRFALTRVWKKIHAKILLSNAFRQPSIQNIDLNPDIKPEKTNVLELETGYLWNEKFSTKINFFDTKINNPIVYLVEQQGENYENYGRVASRGIELEAIWKDQKWGYCKMNYSFYQSYENTVSVYAVPQKGIALSKDFSEGELLTSSSLLGIPQHKTVVYGSLNVTKNFSLNPSLCLLGRRYGFVGIDEEGIPFVRSFSPQLLIDFQVMKREFLIRGLTLSLGVRNLLDQRILYIQPYNGGSASLPGPSRSFMVRMMYNVPF
ncbi:MAG: TonB-dependent receptor, partial [Flammeovirgaceae bacterium]|nr:TonB-dependent receptor [Flammeovirgaceae bacterium]